MPSLIIQPQHSPLQGTIQVPGDKSISHRAVMLAALADGDSTIHNWLPAGDTIATLEAMKSLGVTIQIDEHSPQRWNLVVAGQGLHGLRESEQSLDCRNAGTCMRLLAGILAGQRFQSSLDGSEQLRQRPMRRIIDPLQMMGARIMSRDGRAPLQFEPATLKGIHYTLPVASGQVKSAILLAGLFANGSVHIKEPGPARDHTERLLVAMGVPLHVSGNVISIENWPVEGRKLDPLKLTVPGDISSAAFILVAASLVPHSNLIVQGVGYNETRTGLVDILSTMGARVGVTNVQDAGGEPMVDLSVQFDELHSMNVGGDLVVRGIDEFPVWAVAATQAAGVSQLEDAAELRVKEVDRIGLLVGELRKMGARIEERADGLTISGPTRLQGAEVNSYGDHRLGMALAVAGLAATGPSTIHGADCIADSFPGYVSTMQSLGADIKWHD